MKGWIALAGYLGPGGHEPGLESAKLQSYCWLVLVVQQTEDVSDLRLLSSENHQADKEPEAAART